MAKNRKTRSTEKSHSQHNSNQIRIIGGQWRGRKLDFPSIEGLRPTGDRTRETLFNWLAGYVEGAVVIDLFAGSGALGIEALSRGASKVSFVELNKIAAHSIRSNLKRLNSNASDLKGQVNNQSAFEFLEQASVESCDLLLIDPPFSENLQNKVLDVVEDAQLMKDSGLIYIEAPKNQSFKLPISWSILKEKQSGQVQFLLLQKNL